MIVFYRKWILNFENMASIPSPNEKRWHNWSETKLIWQACLVLFFIIMANIPSPPYIFGLRFVPNDTLECGTVPLVPPYNMKVTLKYPGSNNTV